MLHRMKAPQTWYLYTYAYPDGTVFYVGKGNRGRIDHHEREAERGCPCAKCCTIREIWATGQPVRKRIVYETLVESDAFERERLLIKQHSSPLLTNVRLYPQREQQSWRKQRDKETELIFEEACAILGVSRRTLERYADAGRIRKYRRGIRNIFFKRSEVERLRDELSEIRPEEDN